MKPTDFAYYLTDFLAKYLPGTVGLSSNTIMSYRDTFSLFLEFCAEQKKIKPEKFSLGNLDRKLIEEYMEWLEENPPLHYIPPETCAWQPSILSAATCNSNFRIAFTRRSRYWRFR